MRKTNEATIIYYGREALMVDDATRGANLKRIREEAGLLKRN